MPYAAILRGRPRRFGTGTSPRSAGVNSNGCRRTLTLAQFEDFCVVAQSVRTAFPVGAQVFDVTRERLHPLPR